MSEELNANSVNRNIEKNIVKPRRGLNTMGLFAILAAFFAAALAGSGGSTWILVLIGAFILTIWAFAEAIVHRLRFYSIFIAILFEILAVAISLNGGRFPILLVD